MAYDFETLVPEIDAHSPMRKLLDENGIPSDRIDYGVAEMKFKLFPGIRKEHEQRQKPCGRSRLLPCII